MNRFCLSRVRLARISASASLGRGFPYHNHSTVRRVRRRSRAVHSTEAGVPYYGKPRGIPEAGPWTCRWTCRLGPRRRGIRRAFSARTQASHVAVAVSEGTGRHGPGRAETGRRLARDPGIHDRRWHCSGIRSGADAADVDLIPPDDQSHSENPATGAIAFPHPTLPDEYFKKAPLSAHLSPDIACNRGPLYISYGSAGFIAYPLNACTWTNVGSGGLRRSGLNRQHDE